MSGWKSWWKSTRRQVASEWLALWAALYFVIVCNGAFWRAFAATGALDEQGAWRLALGLFIGMVALHAAMLIVVLNRWTTKIVLPLLLMVTAGAVYYMGHYRVYLDPDMVRNVLVTDRKEASELLTPGLVWSVLLYGVLPSLIVWRLQPVKRSPTRGFIAHVLALVLALVTAAAAIGLAYQPMAALMRNQPSLRHLITPGNWIVSLGKVLLDDEAGNGPKTEIGNDAVVTRPADARPRLLLLVVGETVRAQNWGLNGYVRQTTPQLAELDGINYPDVTACGTNTEVSLPCMFSPQGLRDYDRKAINQSQSLLHVLDRVGVKTLWRDNQSGCKGVCSDLPFESFQHAVIPVHCEGDRCLDSVLLDGLKKRIDATPGDVVVVLHMLGNHGPAYFRRYPPEFRRFTPTCDTDQLAECDVNAIVNSYDNSVLYTDEVLAQAVALLKQESATHDTALLYLSDHGESLGEAGLYLHGVPRSIAPDTQLKVPMWLWLSPELRQADGIDMACADAGRKTPRTHDAMFSTVLGLMRVRTNVYAPEQDLLNGCRATKPAAQASAQ